MFLAHAGDVAGELVPLVADMAPVEYVFAATQDKLNGKVPTRDVVRIYVPSFLEEKLALVIRDLELRKSLEETLTPGELYKLFVVALENEIESMMWDVYELFLEARPRWIQKLVKPLEGNVPPT